MSKSWGAWIGGRKGEISALQEKLEKVKKERDTAIEELNTAVKKSKATTQKTALTTRTGHAAEHIRYRSQQARGR